MRAPLLGVVTLVSGIACAHAPRTEAHPAPAPEQAAPVEPPSPRAPVTVAGRSASELSALVGDATFLEDRDLRAGVIDDDAMERWFTRPPSRVYLYAEGAEPDGACRPLRRIDTNVLNELALVASRAGRERTLWVLGQESVRSETQVRERDGWQTVSIEPLPMRAITWAAGVVRYAEGAERYEIACVPALRSVPCSAEAPGDEGYCVDRALVIRPWRPSFVPHVGPVTPGYADAVPTPPEGRCAVTCEPSDCARAIATSRLPRTPLYRASAAEIAVFVDRATCRAFERERAGIGGG